MASPPPAGLEPATSPVPSYLLPDTATIGADGSLQIGGLRLVDLAHDFGTPLFVYDETELRSRCREAVEAFGPGVAYASKAFLCRAMARLAYEEGMHIDVASGGELHVVLAAGVPADRVVLHGNNKSLAELRYGLDVGVHRIVIDSFDEIDRLETLHAETGQVATALIRVTPGVEAHTHEFISTGQNDSKFGFTAATGMAAKAVRRLQASPAVNLVGIHSHIGSQVFRAESFRAAAKVIGQIAIDFGVGEVSVGGGLGVAYVSEEEAPTIAQWAAMVHEALDEYPDLKVTAEPGRSIVARAGMTLYEVGTIKHLDGIRTYVSVDGGMSDNPRPVLYGSGYEIFAPGAVAAERPRRVRLVGKHCESGDVIVREGAVPDDLAVGDIIATPVTGAYGYSLASNYNKIPRPAVVFVADGAARLVVRRETYDDLLLADVGEQ